MNSKAETTSAVLTCEHGGNRVPSAYRALLRPLARHLESHRGYDAGALPLAKALARALSAPLFASTISRLLVDLNRSPDHPRLHSRAVRVLPAARRAEIVRTCYEPHRSAVTSAIQSRIGRGERVLHLAIHSFVPVLNGKRRAADLGLLYDPRRRGERTFCAELRRALRAVDPDLRVRMNYPYLGTSDGLTTTLRRRFADSSYLGVEIEMNQRFSAPRDRRRIERAVVQALSAMRKSAGFFDNGHAKGRPMSNGGTRRARRDAVL